MGLDALLQGRLFGFECRASLQLHQQSDRLLSESLSSDLIVPLVQIQLSKLLPQTNRLALFEDLRSVFQTEHFAFSLVDFRLSIFGLL